MAETPWQKITLVALWLAFLSVVVVSAASVIGVLSEGQRAELGAYVDRHSGTILAFLVAAVPGFIAFFWGKQSGRNTVQRKLLEK